MRKLLIIIPLFCLLLAGCTEDKEKTSQEEKDKALPTSIQKHIAKDQIVIVNTSSNLNEVLSGSRITYNLPLMLHFLDDVEEKKDSTLKITIVNHNGKSTTNELNFQNGEFVFINHYRGYEVPVGEFHCSDVLDDRHGQLGIEGCKEPDAINNMPAVLFSNAEYQAATNEYRESKK